MNEQEIVNLLKKEKKEKEKHDKQILSALNIYEQLNVHEQPYKKNKRKVKSQLKSIQMLILMGVLTLFTLKSPKKSN
ncbi:hypothetical protein CPX_001797 [Candidatus Phytoplasma pruni]|uniref:Uncharacterized protein n=1 Tax=Candidatus Phytoplasma pruni TaxID=479893 RepID=A0A0M1MZL2_9MOLU|nr:hypothetical protein [Candidatus Phytoplasma pruni]KOR75235.1 hypothetical protein CPX_001797 [Candidatus Phytoplasma pruni]